VAQLPSRLPRSVRDRLISAQEIMNRCIQVIGLSLAVLALATGTSAQKQTQKTASTPQKQAGTPLEFGKSYATLRPEQKRLLDDYIRRYDATTGNKTTPEQAYDGARMSVRTTFDAVTHALLTTTLTNEKGHSLGRAIDLVDALDEVMGEEAGTGGDQQFRMYVYLKPTAFETLSSSREFYRDKDNTVYHKGFPLCFRLKKGPPSIQFSISRDQRMADVDVDYRSSTFPKALFNGHLNSSNSDVRAGNNLEKHDDRWAGLNGWWRELFGFSLGGSAKLPKESATGRARDIPLNPRLTTDQGVDASAHDFLKSWVVDKQPKNAVAYLSRSSYPCLEAMAQKRGKPVPPGMVRLRTAIAMEQFNASTGTMSSVGEMFEPATNWAPELKEAKNAYPAEFRLVSVPPDMAQDEECGLAPDEGASKKSKEKYYATAFRGKQGDRRNKVMLLLWTEEGKYWKIVAIRVEDSGDAGLTPTKTAAAPPVSEAEPEKIAGDPNAVKDITSFYQSWVGKRDTASAALYASENSYECLAAPSEAEKKMKLLDRIQKALEKPLPRVPQGANLSDMMSSVQPVNELVRPVEQENSKAFAIMAVPDQMADSFLCQRRHLPEKTAVLKPSDAKYGAYYLSASRLKFGEEESPALLLLWTKEKDQWKVIAWAVEVP
jgi:hypothetical protein